MHETLSVITDNINVTAISSYIAAQSKPEDQQYVFSYTITITNNSNESVQLLSRYWKITDADGKVTTVEGKGVIGEQPNISPAKNYTYTSGSLLKTPVGTMQGYYKMITSKGENIDVEIPVFRLAIPNILN